MRTTRTPSAEPHPNLIRITPQSEAVVKKLSPGLASRHDYINNKFAPSKKGTSAVKTKAFYNDFFRRMVQSIPVGSDVFDLENVKLSSAKDADKRKEFKEYLHKQFGLTEKEADNLVTGYNQDMPALSGIALYNSIPTSSVPRPNFLRDRAQPYDLSQWSFGSDVDSVTGQKYIYFDIREKVEFVKRTPPEEVIPIPGFAITRYRCNQSTGGFEWLYTDVSNDILERFMVSPSFPPFEITEKMKQSWRQAVALEATPGLAEIKYPESKVGRSSTAVVFQAAGIEIKSAAAPLPAPSLVATPPAENADKGFFGGVKGFFYGLAAGFVTAVQRAAVVSPPLGPIGFVEFFLLATVGGIVGAIYGAAAGAVYGKRNGFPSDVGHMARVQTLARYPFSGNDATRDFQQQSSTQTPTRVTITQRDEQVSHATLSAARREGSVQNTGHGLRFLSPPGAPPGGEPGMHLPADSSTPVCRR
jgi:hypothetical protein